MTSATCQPGSARFRIPTRAVGVRTQERAFCHGEFEREVGDSAVREF